MDPNDLYSIGGYVEEKDRNLSKHTLFDYDTGLRKFKLLTIGQIAAKRIKPGVDLPEFLVRFVSEQGIVLMIPNRVNEYVTGVQIRALKERKFETYGSNRFTPYGLGELETEFNYRKTIIVTEGALDCECLRLFYKNVIAMSTAGMSAIQREIMDNISYRVVLAYDNDEAGERAFYKDRKYFTERDIICERLRHPEGVKDPGSIADYMFEGKIWELNNLKEYYRNAIEVLMPHEEGR